MIKFLEKEAGVRAPEPKGVRKGATYGSCPRLMRDIIEITPLVGVVEVYRGRYHILLDAEDADHGFDAAGSTEEMAGH